MIRIGPVHPHWVLGVIVAATLIAGPAALAGSPTMGVDQSAGKVGKHHLQDSEAAPAGACKHGYHPEGTTGYYNGVRRVIVKRPVVFARAGHDTQRISWRVVIQAWPSAGSAWTFVDKTAWQSRIATPDSRAPFKRLAVVIDSYPHHGEWGSIRSRVDLRWHGHDGSVVGSARLFPDWYRIVEGGLELGRSQSECGLTTG